MAIAAELVENTFDTGDEDDLTVVKQIKVTVPYVETFSLDPDEADTLLSALEDALIESGFYS
jgi:hypothetical protein